MLKLENIRKNMMLLGVENVPVEIKSAEMQGDNAVEILYKISGMLRERLLGRGDEEKLAVDNSSLGWTFDGNGDMLKLALEAKRIDMAYLFDPMMAVHTSNVVPLPHQITAVYEAMLPRRPLRFLLADDPGAGKTIMAGLLIRELILRADAKRVLIVSPGGLASQWQDELYEKFGLCFEIFSTEMLNSQFSQNPFIEKDLLIARLDQLSRNEELQDKLTKARWDLVVFDEAHKLSASWTGNEVKKTGRFKLGELLGAQTRNLLLMTATPHNGKEDDFQTFLSLLDTDRFYGKERADGNYTPINPTDYMRRLVKEELYKFDGTKLFPERRAYTVNYKLSNAEVALYEAVTAYVCDEMNKADQLGGQRKGNVGFALTSLQRRLASSPEAIYRSLTRRKERLTRRLEEEKLHARGFDIGTDKNYLPGDIYESDEELDGNEYESFEQEITDRSTAAKTATELQKEINILAVLEQQAKELRLSGVDKKWEQFSKILTEEKELRDESCFVGKLIVFTEHRDTLTYLVDKIKTLLGKQEAVVEIQGSTPREERRRIQERFRNDVDVRILVATDAAGEGVNLQNAHLMINYDMPWNPNRLEQRFGRIHRIGQKEICHLWNLVANETREGDVYSRLLKKLEIEREALGGRVFDILGEVFENHSLRDLLIEAIRYGKDVDVLRKIEQVVDNALDTEHLRALMKRDALCEEVMSPDQLYAVRDEMEKAEARKLQPYFIRSFFIQAFKQIGGTIYERESGRYEIKYVPHGIVERSRLLAGRGNVYVPIVEKYERVCFKKEEIDYKGKPQAALLHPGHPLMMAVTDIVIERGRGDFARGAVFVDDNNQSGQLKTLYLLEHAIKDGRDKVISKRLQFLYISDDGEISDAGYAPHLDLRTATAEEQLLLKSKTCDTAATHTSRERMLGYAVNVLAVQHYSEVNERRQAYMERTLSAVHERLTNEINYWQDRYMKLSDDSAAGKTDRLNADNVKRTVLDLTQRLQSRTRELEAMRNVINTKPEIIGAALVFPAGALTGVVVDVQLSSVDSGARRAVELAAMQAVSDYECAAGYIVKDVSEANCGWDITAEKVSADGKILDTRHIEVKGRAAGQTTVTVTRNEILTALNQGDKFWLAVVFVDGDNVDGPHYARQPFDKEPGWGEVSSNYDVKALLQGGRKKL
ncbi:MAG: helicase-related protein [Bacillota bacterium]